MCAVCICIRARVSVPHVTLVTYIHTYIHEYLCKHAQCTCTHIISICTHLLTCEHTHDCVCICICIHVCIFIARLPAHYSQCIDVYFERARTSLHVCVYCMNVCVCIYVYTHTAYMCIYVHIYIHTYIYIHTHACV
jgi:hypothetical protein